jgi:hypothetical protein
MSAPVIITHYDPKPVPFRNCDWSAVISNYDASWEGEESGWVSNEPIGYGPTEAAAVQSLTDQLEECA